MKISPKGLDFIKGFESFVPWVYDDLVAARKVNGKLVYREWNGEPVKGTLTIGVWAHQRRPASDHEQRKGWHPPALFI